MLRASLEAASGELCEGPSALKEELERKSAELSQPARSREELSVKMEAGRSWTYASSSQWA